MEKERPLYNIHELAAKWQAGTITPEEKRYYENWYRSFDDSVTEAEGRPGETTARASDRIYRGLQERISSARRRRLFISGAIAASGIILASLTAYLVITTQQQKQPKQQQYSKHQPQDIAPGKQTATLTLASGEKLVLSNAANGRIAIQGGTTVRKTADGQLIYNLNQSQDQAQTQNQTTAQTAYNILTTAVGETYKLQLPDGSLVWLNAGSSLRYPANFTGTERLVELSGEAYFEVVHNSKQPFRVRSEGQLIEDIGTRFNINSYADEPATETTLLEGAVSVTAVNENNASNTSNSNTSNRNTTNSNNPNKKILLPGQQASNNGRALKVREVNVSAVTDWKDGRFYLNHLEFREAMRKIARWYNIEVIYDDDLPKDLEIGGWIPRSVPLSAVLKSIEASRLARFKLEGRRLYVSK